MRKEKKENIILFICLLILSAISFLGLSQFSANYLIKQIIWLITGLFILMVIKKINIKIIFKFSLFIYLINILLLLLVLLIGRQINGSRAWFTFGFLSFQPSELMKISLSLVYFNLLKFKQPKQNWLSIMVIITLFLLPAILVFLEPDTGAIIMYFIIMIVALFNSNIKKSYLMALSGLGLAIIIALIIIYTYNSDLIIKLFGSSIFYRLDRIIHFKNNYQLNQALIYIGSCGLFGHKEMLYIPEAHTDFIFSFLIGKYGIILAIIILFCYLIVDFVLINKTKKNLFIKFFLYTFLFNQIYNILMNIGLVPIMGIPLPFLSYGGTNTIISLIFLGLCLNQKIKAENFNL